MIEYTDPILLKRPNKLCRTKTSDIYSIGILLWEISSKKMPYKSKFRDELDLIIYVLWENREDPIIGTPQNYINIYQDCWNQNPDQRPNIRKVIQDLNHINLQNIAKYIRIIEPFVPLISAVTLEISEIIAVYETVQYNKKICNSLMNRINASEATMKTLLGSQTENEKNFLSSLQVYQKFEHSSSIKDIFGSLVNDFDAVMTKLHFIMAISNDKQRWMDQFSLKSDIADMDKVIYIPIQF
ncbi:hypothetical protein Glove_132g136 [Diversispora epigaea]|uniref:Protein kinase domain-containing protein n=1 Tax=Diversispora epigaea TaxID=1348612 RepID=A0A397IXI9_9GLOM|nr:hypothetical protein Glove_132g136 [Diversispora epigaea]